MDINRRATIGEGHICLQGKNLSFNKYMIFYIHDKQSINQWYEILKNTISYHWFIDNLSCIYINTRLIVSKWFVFKAKVHFLHAYVTSDRYKKNWNVYFFCWLLRLYFRKLRILVWFVVNIRLREANNVCILGLVVSVYFLK